MMSTKNHQFLTPPRSAHTWQFKTPPFPPLSSNFCVDVIEVRFLYLPSRVKQSVNFPTYCNSYSLKCSCAHNLGSLQCGIPFYISIMIFLACLGVTLNSILEKCIDTSINLTVILIKYTISINLEDELLWIGSFQDFEIAEDFDKKCCCKKRWSVKTLLYSFLC